MRAKPRIADPRCAYLAEALAALEPRQELTYHLALMGLSPHCQGDRFWQARTSELQLALRLTADTHGAILAAARSLADQLLADAGA